MYHRKLVQQWSPLCRLLPFVPSKTQNSSMPPENAMVSTIISDNMLAKSTININTITDYVKLMLSYRETDWMCSGQFCERKIPSFFITPLSLHHKCIPISLSSFQDISHYYFWRLILGRDKTHIWDISISKGRSG